MKAILSFLAITFVGVHFSSASAEGPFSFEVARRLLNPAIPMAATGVFKWKVGDTLNFDFIMKPVPVTAYAKLQVTKVTDDALTLVEEIGYKTMKQTVETELDANTGEVKSTKINGKSQKMPQGGTSAPSVKVVEEEESHLTVKAGEFDAIHVVTEDQSGNRSHIWLNPRDIPISGLIKTSTVQSVFTIEMELASFVRGH